MGIFKRRHDNPTRTSQVKSANSTATEQPKLNTRLIDPGLSDNDLTQRVYGLITNCGLTFYAYGPGSVEELFDQVAHAVPDCLKSEAHRFGLGLLFGNNRMPWVMLHGDEGSAVAFFVFPESDTDYYAKHVSEPLDNLQSPWRSTLGTSTGDAKESLAKVINSARAVPIWDISAFAHTRP